MPRLFADCTAPNTNDLGLKSNKSVLDAVTFGDRNVLQRIYCI